jgi:glycosyltransferase involved in cell wall biosynthesis
MKNIICLDENFSTTRLLTKEKIEIVISPKDKFESVLFLSEGEERKGEGGLRTKGYYKKSYEDKPLISIVTVVYNGEKFLEETILSVINQTYDNIEYIIIDGGSNDGTIDIIKKYEDKIDYWISEKDKGIYDAMNKGIIKASGNLVNLLNAGDKLYDSIVIAEVVKSYKPDIKLIYGDTIFYNEDIKKEKYQKSLEFTRKNIIKKTTRVVCHQSMFFNKEDMPLFSRKYRLKDELKQYFDLSKIDKAYIKIDIPISIFLEGGEGSKYFFENMKEKVMVVYAECGYYGVIIALPLIIRSLMSRVYKLIVGFKG